MLQGQEADDGLDAARGAGGVPGEGFGRRDLGQVIAEDAAQCGAFGHIVVGRCGAVRVDIVDVTGGNAGSPQGLRHRQVRAFAVLGGGRLMVGVAGIAPPFEHRQRAHTAGTGGTFPLEHHESGAFAQVQSGAIVRERTAGVAVENHQSPKPIEMKAREAFAASHDHTIKTAGTNEVGPEDEGVGGRGAGRAAGGDEGKRADVVGHFPGGLGAVAELLHPPRASKLALGAIHRAHGGAGHQRRAGDELRGDLCLLEGFAQCNHAHQRGARTGFGSLGQAAQLIVGQRHLAHGQFAVDGGEEAHGMQPGACVAQGLQRLGLVGADGRKEAGSGDDDHLVRCWAM